MIKIFINCLISKKNKNKSVYTKSSKENINIRQSNNVILLFFTTYLNKAHADGTHLGELINGLEAVVDGLGQQLSKLLVVENLQAAAAGNLTHCRRMEAVVVVTVTTLDEDTAVAQTLCIHLPTNVIQMDT